MTKPKNEIAAQNTQAVVMSAKEGTLLPTLAGASEHVQSQMAEIKDNFESLDGFRLPRAKMTPAGFELIEGQPVLTELEGVIIHTKKTNVYYAKAYNKHEVSMPDCYSLDGITPDKKVEKPVHKTCKGCPMAEFGTNSMKSGKACRNLKPLYMLLGDDAIMPRQVTITPASLRAVTAYLMELAERGIAYRKVKTKIVAYKSDPTDTYVKLKFVMGAKVDEQKLKDIEFLKAGWLHVMNEQMIDQHEADTTQGPVDTKGEY